MYYNITMIIKSKKYKSLIKVDFKIFQAKTGLTQKQIAEKIGCSQGFIGLLLSGKRKSKRFTRSLLSLMESIQNNTGN